MHGAVDAEAAVRAEKAEAKRRAAMCAALDRKRGMGWSVEVETASRPVMPVGMSSMRSSSGTLRLGEEGLEVPEGPREGGGRRGKGVSGGGGGNSGEGRGGRRSPRRREKGGKDVVPIVDSGGEGRILNFGREKEGGAGGKRLTSWRVLAWEQLQEMR